jgi:hypothetical protein
MMVENLLIYGKKITARGFSVVEVVLVMGVLAVFSSGAVVVVLGGLSANRAGIEETTATQYNSEGIEAARSIRNRSFTDLINSSGTGVTRSAGVWVFSGTNNNFDKYQRTLSISEVRRDESGNIVEGGGTVDPNTKKVTAITSWQVSAARQKSTSLSTYLTNWQEPLGGLPNPGGILVYGDGGTTSDIIRYKVLDGLAGTWSGALPTADVDSSTANRALRAARVYASPTRQEKILLSRHYDGSGQYIYGQVFNGTNWGNVILLSSWQSSSFLDVRNFDGTYLANGDFLAFYSDNSSLPKYRAWNGSSWSAEYSVQNVGGVPNYLTARARPGTNEVMLSSFDQGSDTNTQYFTGGSYATSNWTLHPEHSPLAPTNTKEHFSFVWSPNNPLVGALVYSDDNRDKNLNIRIWTADGAGGGNWSSSANASGQVGRLGTMALAGRLKAEEFIACDQDDVGNPNIVCYQSDFTPSWSDPVNQTVSSGGDRGLQRSFDLEYEASSAAEAIIVYSDRTSVPKLKKYLASTSTWDGTETSLNALSGNLKTVELVSQEGSDEIMILLADESLNLYSLVWDGTSNGPYLTPSGKAFTLHSSNGSAPEDYWYSFTWDRFR